MEPVNRKSKSDFEKLRMYFAATVVSRLAIYWAENTVLGNLTVSVGKQDTVLCDFLISKRCLT